MQDCFVAFGSNEGDSNAIYEQVIQLFRNWTDAKWVQSSQPVQTLAVGGPADQAPYLNAAFHFRSSLDPSLIHQKLIDVEEQLGRQRRVRWGSRNVDLDLLLVGDCIQYSPKLTLPHPRMSFRRFVIQPLLEIAREFVHPVSGLTIAELLDRLNQKADLVWWCSSRPDRAQRLWKEIKGEHPQLIKPWTIEWVSQMEFEERATDPTETQPKLLLFEVESMRTGGPSLFLGHAAEAETKMEIAAALAAVK